MELKCCGRECKLIDGHLVWLELKTCCIHYFVSNFSLHFGTNISVVLHIRAVKDKEEFWCRCKTTQCRKGQIWIAYYKLLSDYEKVISKQRMFNELVIQVVWFANLPLRWDGVFHGYCKDRFVALRKSVDTNMSLYLNKLFSSTFAVPQRSCSGLRLYGTRMTHILQLLTKTVEPLSDSSIW